MPLSFTGESRRIWVTRNIDRNSFILSEHRVLLIGAGLIARRHVEAYSRMGIRVAGIADSVESRAKEFIRCHNLEKETAAWGDYRQALDREGFDIVSICTPTPFHCPLTVDCLNAGSHVLLEKPMAMSLEECDIMIDAAEKNNRILSVVAQNRYKTEQARVREIIASGKCGRVLYARAASAWWRGEEYYNSWHGKWDTEGGGCTLNLAVHQIDLLLWIAGKPGEISAVMSNVNHPGAEVEDLSMAALRFAEGPAAGGLGEILASTVHHGENQQMLFQTEKAGLFLPFAVRCTRARERGLPLDDPDTAAEIEAVCGAYPPLERETFDGQIADFVNRIETGAVSRFLPDGGSGRNVIEAVTGIYKSAVTRRPVSLPIAKDDPFYLRDGLLNNMERYNNVKRR
jgi:predicted dehydrogenase